MKRVLLLAGTAEARALARGLKNDVRFSVIASFAGATSAPAGLGVETRTGGFGGRAGLARFIGAEGIELLVDATHPFAVQMKASAAAQIIPVCHVIRPAWQPEAGDNWIGCASLADAAAKLPADARAFLALGQRHLDAFQDHPANLWVRSVEAAGAETAMNRLVGNPGSVDEETALLTHHGFTHLVCRNSGGKAGYSKIEAARRLALPVLMIRRPEQPEGTLLETVGAALEWCRARSGQDGG